MRKVPIYFDGGIALYDVMRAAESIGCTVRRDTDHPKALCLVKKTTTPTMGRHKAHVIDLCSLPNFLKPQAD